MLASIDALLDGRRALVGFQTSMIAAAPAVGSARGSPKNRSIGIVGNGDEHLLWIVN
jgi:hypothetical protein